MLLTLALVPALGVGVDPSLGLSPASAAEEASAADRYQRARSLLVGGRYEEALDILQALREELPEQAALAEARCHRELGQLEQAEQCLRRAEEAEGKGGESDRVAAERARLAFEAGRWDDVRRFAEQALRRNPRSVPARWWLAELDRVQGQVDRAHETCAQLVAEYGQGKIDDEADLRWVGLAAGRQARRQANSEQFKMLVRDFYPARLRADPGNWQARLDAARLLLEKFNRADAFVELQAALSINPRAAEVHAARAALALQDFDLATADTALRRALDIHPRLVEAHRSRADWHLVQLQVSAAARVLEEARNLHPRDEATLGRLAAVFALRDGLPIVPDSRAAKLIDEVTARNDQCGTFFTALADTLDRTRRFPQAAHYYEEARRRLPEATDATASLGLTYLRLGREAEAAELLREAARRDPFHVRVQNSLAVLEVLAGYAVIETDHFVIRFDRGQDELLAELAAEYLEQHVYPDLVKRLGFEPEGKSLIEIFSRARNTTGHGWFSARMAGLPKIGTVAACAGQVVALVSPHDLPRPYAWARALRHEFVHLVNLQQTHYCVPHWFTEALAVLHEDRPRPPRWNRLLAARYHADRLFTLDNIDLAFLAPSDKDDWTLAYCQAELYAEFLKESFGEEVLERMLAAYAQSLETPAVIARCCGLEMDEFERRYRAHVQKVLKSLKADGPAPSREAAELQRLGDQHGSAARYDQAAQVYRRGLAEHPLRRDIWLKSLARVHLRSGDGAALRDTLRQLAEIDEDSPAIRKKLAQLALADGDHAAAEKWALRALWIDVRDAQSHGLLAESLAGRGRHGEAARAYRRAVRLEPREPVWKYKLAGALVESGRPDEARELLSELLRDQPEFSEARELWEKLQP